MKPRILMCPPEHFDVRYVINPWMEGQRAHFQRNLAWTQWQKLRDSIARHADIALIEHATGWPDMTFTANAALVHENKAVMSRFRHPQRRGEEPYFAAWFEGAGFDVVTPPKDLYFEGAGDALLDRTAPLAWMGYGHRTEARAADFLECELGIDVEALRLIDPRFYHLDTCLCPLERGYLLYYPAAFDAASNRRIEARVPSSRRIAVSEQDALGFACNSVNLGDAVILNAASETLVAALAVHGFGAQRVALGEFMRAGGAAKCLTLRLDEPGKVAARHGRHVAIAQAA